MYWRFGAYNHPDNEVLVRSFAAQRLFGPRGDLDRIITTAVIEGEILATTQATIEAARDVREAVYSNQAIDAALHMDSGAETYHMDFPRVLGIVWHQEEQKAHFATALPYTITLQSEFLADSGLISFQETITKIGNAGARTVWPELDNGPSIPQVVSSNTNVTIIQTGEALSFLNWLTPTIPIYTTPPHLDNPSVTVSRTIINSDIRLQYLSRWNYVFTFNYNETPSGLLPLPR